MIELQLSNGTINFELLIHHPLGKYFSFFPANRNRKLCFSVFSKLMLGFTTFKCQVTITTTAEEFIIVVIIGIAFSQLLGKRFFIRLRLRFAFLEKPYKYQCNRGQNE